MRLLIILSSLLLSPVTPFTTIFRSSSVVLLNSNNNSRRIISNRSVVLSMSSSDASPPSSSRPKQSPQTLSIAILGGGISGLSCASRLLSRHKHQCYRQRQEEGGKEAGAGGCCDYELEVTVYDTGRLRPGGRCSSRFVGDKPPIVKNRSSGVTPVNQRRACDAESLLRNDGNDGSNELAEGGTPSNILKAIYSSSSGNGGGGDSMARILNSMGPIDHAAQIISIPKLNDGCDGMEEFQKQVEQWLASDVLESFPTNSVCELLGGSGSGGDNSDNNSIIKLEPLHGNMYYGKGGMGNIPLTMRDYCLSFNGYGENYTGQSFRIAQDVWVSPSNGVKYIGGRSSSGNGVDDDEEGDEVPQWELRAGSKSLGKYHKLVIAHNGKCADRIMSKTPAKEFHSLLRTKFAPYVPEWGGREMTLNSIYSLVFAVKSDKGDDDDGSDGGTSSIAKAISNLCTSSSSNSHDDGVYTIMIKNEPTLRLLSCNTLKHHHLQNPNSQSNIQIYTLLSSPKFGKQFKGPQEALPLDFQEKIAMKMLSNLENSLGLQEGDVVNEVVDLKLQLWGAAVPMNTWSSSSTSSSSSSSNGVDGFVYDATYGVGAAGDWILDPSIAGAWESGRRLADWILNHHEKKEDVEWSVGLPDSTNNGGKHNNNQGKFVPSRAALESGIGTIPPSPNSTFKFPSNGDEGNQRGGRGGGRGRGRGRGPGRVGRGGRGRGGGGRNGQRASNGGERNSNRREMQQQKVG